MRPKHLKYPFHNPENKRVFMQERVWYVPESGVADYSAFDFQGWESPDMFGNANPVMIEYCSGNGAWIAQKAIENPHINWIALDKRFDRVKRIWAKIQNFQLPNLIAVYGEALFFSQKYLSNACLAGAFINFPDPWPKRHHEKHRLVEPKFLDELNRILKPESELTIVTDDVGYSQWILKHTLAHKDFKSLYPEPYFVQELPGYGTSFFENLWREQGLTIHYHRYQKQSSLL